MENRPHFASQGMRLADHFCAGVFPLKGIKHSSKKVLINYATIQHQEVMRVCRLECVDDFDTGVVGQVFFDYL